MAAIKSYMPQNVVEPFAAMKRKEYSTSREMEIDVNAVYITIEKEVKELM